MNIVTRVLQGREVVVVAHSADSPCLSIVIPVLNEIERLQRDVDYFHGLESPDSEVIFVDGGSHDGSLEYLKNKGFSVFSSPVGRARQMNTGAANASGQYLLFVHCDTYLPKNFSAKLFQNARYSWGFFRIALDSTQWIFSLIAGGINFRSKLFRVATGDQCIFVSREIFHQVKGYKDIALMEDIELTRRLKKLTTPKIFSHVVTSSARRWQARGVVKTVLLMWSLQLAFKLGVSPEKIREWYR